MHVLYNLDEVLTKHILNTTVLTLTKNLKCHFSIDVNGNIAQKL